jgi:two-component system CheB/CheR fusion protein
MPEPSGKKKFESYSAASHSVSDPDSTSLPYYSAAIVETVREPLVLLDAGLRVLVANAAFYRAFGVTPELVRRRSLFDLADGRWDAPELHNVLRALQDRDFAFEDHEVSVTMNGQPRVFRLNARKLEPLDADSSLICWHSRT